MLSRLRHDPAILHGLALLAAVATFPLIFMGGLVTSHQAGMSVPDWPNSWGYNMFLFPISQWVGGIFYEHTHRLAGATVGFLVLVPTALAWYQRRFRWTALALLAAVCIQGVIGGLRVRWADPRLAVVHACTAQLFFCFAVTFCVLTSRFWTTRPRIHSGQFGAAERIRIAAAVAFAAVFMQLVIGAIMRHSDAGLAIPDFPTSFGHWLPPLTLTNDFRSEMIHRYGLDLDIAHLTLFQIWIHFAHRIGALIVTAAMLCLTIPIIARLRECKPLFRPAVALLILLAAQITLGILTVLLRKPADIASAHVAVGSLVLATTWMTFFRLSAMIRWSGQTATPSPKLELAST